MGKTKQRGKKLKNLKRNLSIPKNSKSAVAATKIKKPYLGLQL